MKYIFLLCHLFADEVAVIDEIQMMRDVGRGWSWTRALLGVAANEIHLCGEAAAIELVKELCYQIGETVEVSLNNLCQLLVWYHIEGENC